MRKAGEECAEDQSSEPSSSVLLIGWFEGIESGGVEAGKGREI